jgi:hypothetical protein
LNDEKELDAIKEVLMGMNCIPVFFNEEKYDSVVEFMYLGFCKQVLWPSFHNVDLLDLATNGWGQRQRNTRSDPVQACALAEAEANERKRSESLGGAPPSPGDGGSQKLRSDWDQVRVICSSCSVVYCTALTILVYFRADWINGGRHIKLSIVGSAKL